MGGSMTPIELLLKAAIWVDGTLEKMVLKTSETEGGVHEKGGGGSVIVIDAAACEPFISTSAEPNLLQILRHYLPL